MKGRCVDLTVLIQNEHYQISEQFSNGEKRRQPNLEEGKKTGEALCHKIAQSDCEVRYIFLSVYFIKLSKLFRSTPMRVVKVHARAQVVFSACCTRSRGLESHLELTFINQTHTILLS